MELNDKQIAIINVAEQLISEKGFEATTIREISKRAKINLAMISYYFGSKEKLLEAMFVQKSNQFRLQTDLLIQQSAELSSIEIIHRLAENYFNKVFSNFCFHKIMLTETSYIDSTIVFDQIWKMKSNNFDLITSIIKKGIEKGEINKNVTTEMVISTMNGTIANYVINEKFYRIKWNLKENEPFENQTKEKIKNQIKYSLNAILIYDENK